MDELELESAFTEDVQQTPFEAELATVKSIKADGLELVFDGLSESDGKVYPCNACVEFRVGDRVKVKKISGTYVAEYPLGAPGSRVGGGEGDEPTTVSRLVNGNYITSLNGGTFANAGTSNAALGSATKPWAGLYTTGNISLGNTSAKIGFFGTTPVSKITLSTSGNNQGFSTITSSNLSTTGVRALNNLIGILKNYGLIA